MRATISASSPCWARRWASASSAYGVDWPTVSAIVSASVVVFVFLVWVRPRLFRSWRLLELCLHAGKRFPATRALVDAVRCANWARHYELPTYVVARLRVEADLLTGGQDRGKIAEGERGWREHFRAMLADEHRLARGDGWIGAADEPRDTRSRPRFRIACP